MKLIASLAVVFLFFLPALAMAGPELKISETKVVLEHPVPAGHMAKAIFQLKNCGDADLEISRVNTSCRCMVPYYDRVIKPGCQGRIELTVDTTGLTGRIRKRAIVQTNDPQHPKVMLEVVVNVK